MVEIEGTTIRMTRGDTFVAEVGIYEHNGDPYVPVEGDKVRFAMKDKGRNRDTRPRFTKDIPIDTLILRLDPIDTAKYPYGEYGYDIELTKANGVVDTFISEATIELRWEAD